MLFVSWSIDAQPDLVKDFSTHFAAMWADKETFGTTLTVTAQHGRKG
jgi:hypothetical protein